MRAQALPWRRVEPGWYEAEDPQGSHWRIVQGLSRKWAVICNGLVIAEWPHTLTEAKQEAEDEADPEIQALRERQRAARREARRARAAQAPSTGGDSDAD